MKIFIRLIVTFSFLLNLPAIWAYTNLTTTEVHTRLVQKDTLLLLDVRETYEYTSGHIAEPTGQLPLTPVNMPWSSNILKNEYQRLPQNIDILVYCRSGGRSASASSFLESKGFTRIFNMTGGFSSWKFESRDSGYGDHTGNWVHSTDTNPVVIINSETSDTSRIIFSPSALPELDSIYIELHFAYFKEPAPPDVSLSDVKGLFRLTVLDHFGLSLFSGDSLTLSAPIDLHFSPIYDDPSKEITASKMLIYVPGYGWQEVDYQFDNAIFSRKESVLRRWYNVEGQIKTNVKQLSSTKKSSLDVFPNPFNTSLKIIAPYEAQVSIYDIFGRYVRKLNGNIWNPGTAISSGTYFINIQSQENNITKKVLYLK